MTKSTTSSSSFSSASMMHFGTFYSEGVYFEGSSTSPERISMLSARSKSPALAVQAPELYFEGTTKRLLEVPLI